MKQLEEFVESIFTDRICSPDICGCQVMNRLRLLPALGEQNNTELEGMPTGVSTPRLFADFF